MNSAKEETYSPLASLLADNFSPWSYKLWISWRLKNLHYHPVIPENCDWSPSAAWCSFLCSWIAFSHSIGPMIGICFCLNHKNTALSYCTSSPRFMIFAFFCIPMSDISRWKVCRNLLLTLNIRDRTLYFSAMTFLELISRCFIMLILPSILVTFLFRFALSVEGASVIVIRDTMNDLTWLAQVCWDWLAIVLLHSRLLHMVAEHRSSDDQLCPQLVCHYCQVVVSV